MKALFKEKYSEFCRIVDVPIYSKAWWLDAVCLPQNWDVWICEKNGTMLAAMPYYFEVRGKYRYITKAPLTQNNGIIFNYPPNIKESAKAVFEERIIDEACEFIESLNLDVYEQQFSTSFNNWLPFYWNNYSSIVRYTYVIENTNDLNLVWNGISSKRRSIIKKGQRNSEFSNDISFDQFYKEHEKIYKKQDLKCPFSYELWIRLANACLTNNSGLVSCRRSKEGEVAAVSFVVWDKFALYKIMGGAIPEYSTLDAYSALTWDEIELANKYNIIYDFEGSVIKRISKSFREYGGIAKPYFRIRKIFNPEIVWAEAENYIKHIWAE